MIIMTKLKNNKIALIPDIHVHTYWCNHSSNTLEDVFRQQEQAGNFIAINEHMPLPVEMLSDDYLKYSGLEGVTRTEVQKQKIKGQSMLLSDLRSFLEEYSIIKKQFRGKVVLGFELDYTHGFEKQISETLSYSKQMAQDLGISINHFSLSEHYYKGEMMWTVQTMRQILDIEGYEKFVHTYFQNLIDGIQGKIEGFKPDFVCHPGLMHFLLNQSNHFANMSNNFKREIYYEGFRSLIDVALQEDVALEVNSSGYDRPFLYGAPIPEHYHKMPFDCPNPFFPEMLLREAIEKDVKLVVGSDNHHQGQEFRNFEKARNLLLRNGATKVYKIVNHEKIAVDLE